IGGHRLPPGGEPRMKELGKARGLAAIGAIAVLVAACSGGTATTAPTTAPTTAASTAASTAPSTAASTAPSAAASPSAEASSGASPSGGSAPTAGSKTLRFSQPGGRGEGF